MNFWLCRISFKAIIPGQNLQWTTHRPFSLASWHSKICSFVQCTILILPSSLNVLAFATLKGAIVLSIGGYFWPAIKHGPWYCCPPCLGWLVLLTNGIAGVAVFFFGAPFHPLLVGCFPINLPFPCPPPSVFWLPLSLLPAVPWLSIEGAA